LPLSPEQAADAAEHFPFLGSGRGQCGEFISRFQAVGHVASFGLRSARRAKTRFYLYSSKENIANITLIGEGRLEKTACLLVIPEFAPPQYN
jgi:hypothetical protein